VSRELRHPEGKQWWDPATSNLTDSVLADGAERLYMPKTDLASYPEYEAIVLEIIPAGGSGGDLTKASAYEARNSKTSDTKSKTYSIIARVTDKNLALLPESPDPGDGMSLDNDLINMEFEFEASSNAPDAPPQMRERVRVNWLKKTGWPITDWDYPIYLGPINERVPQIVPLPPKRDVAKDAFLGENGGQASVTPAPGSAEWTGTGTKNFSEEPEPTIENKELNYENIVSPSLSSGPLPSKIYDKKEIYVEKKLDFPDLEKIKIFPHSKRKETIPNAIEDKLMYRKDFIAYLLPEEEFPRQRKNTKMIIINETGDYHSATHNNIRKHPLMHFGIAMNSRPDGAEVANKSQKECAVRVNIPYGLVLGDKQNIFSENCVGCMISSPFDGSGKNFLNLNIRTKISPDQIVHIKNMMHQWVISKTIPGDSEALILGPFGTPGLRTGPNPDQSSEVKDLNLNTFERGRLTWTKTGHYILPTMTQAHTLYELINSLIKNPPLSNYSWGLTKPRSNNHQLIWSFPSVGGGSPTFLYSNFIRNENKRMTTSAGFPWGLVGENNYRSQSKFNNWWKNSLSKHKNIFGIISNSRWNNDEGGTFLEYYLLSRSLELTHKEAWYAALGAVSETFPKRHGGVGLGPTPLPKSANRNKLIQKGQQMWVKATVYLRRETASKGVLLYKNQPNTAAIPGKKEISIIKANRRKGMVK